MASEMSALVHLAGRLDELVDIMWLMFGGLVLVALVVMIIIQVLKELLPLRRLYQYIRMWFWVWAHYTDSMTLFFKQTELHWSQYAQKQPSEVESVLFSTEKQLKDLKYGSQAIKNREIVSRLSRATLSKGRASYLNLPAERFTGQLGAAVQGVLENPLEKLELFLTLSAGARPQDQMYAVIGSVIESEAARGGEIHKDTLEQLIANTISAREAVASRIEENIDEIHYRLSGAWAYIQRFMAVISGIVIVTLIGRQQVPKLTDEPGELLVLIVIGVLGGYVATVLRDLFVAMQSLRSRD